MTRSRSAIYRHARRPCSREQVRNQSGSAPDQRSPR